MKSYLFFPVKWANFFFFGYIEIIQKYNVILELRFKKLLKNYKI